MARAPWRRTPAVPSDTPAIVTDRPVPPGLAEAAVDQPGSLVFEIDPDQVHVHWDGPIPAEAVAGAWVVDDEGKLTGEFAPNPHYRPLPPGAPRPEAPASDCDGKVTGVCPTSGDACTGNSSCTSGHHDHTPEDGPPHS